jgi:glycosyltransferase involved in cell wall biosynthesis
MKIGFDAKRAFLNQTGLGNYCRSFIDLLAESDKKIFLILYSPKNSKYSKSLRNNISTRFPSNIFGIFNGIFWRSIFVSTKIKADRLDFFVGMSHELPYFLPDNVKKIVVIHDLIFEKHPDFFPKIDRFFYSFKTKRACRIADKIIAVGEQTKADLMDIYTISPEKISVIPPAINSIFWEKQKNILENYLNEKYFLYVGALSERKNFDRLIAGFAKFSEKNKEIKLFVVGRKLPGEADFYKKIKNMVAEKNLTDRVRFFENEPTENLPAFYQNAVALVFPSRAEGFGMPIAEALASKTAVICNDLPVFREVAGNDGAIFTDVENSELLHESLILIYENNDLRNKIIENGHRFVIKFSEKNIQKSILNFFFDSSY